MWRFRNAHDCHWEKKAAKLLAAARVGLYNSDTLSQRLNAIIFVILIKE